METRKENEMTTSSNTVGVKTVDVPIRLDIDSMAPQFSRALSGLDKAAGREADAAGIPTACGN